MARITIEYRVTVDVPTEIAHNELTQRTFEHAFNKATERNLSSGSYTDHLPTGTVETLWATFDNLEDATICGYHLERIARGDLNFLNW